MSTNPFKSFIPFSILWSDAAFIKAKHEDHPAMQPRDPSAGEWSTMHFCEPMKGEGLIVHVGGRRLLAVQFNERILPGKVRDEQVTKAVVKLEQQQGHKISKKEYAQLRDQVEFDMLPRAFIRRTVVQVIISKGYMLVCTTSAKRCDDAVALLQSTLGDGLAPWKISTVLLIPAVLTTLAKDGSLSEHHAFYPTDSAVLKGSGKKVIRIKDKDTQEQDVQALLNQEYEVHELGIRYGEDEDNPDLTFTINDKFVFKRVTLPDVKVPPHKEDFMGFAELCASTYSDVLYNWVLACGGLAEMPKRPAVIDDEDDL